MRVNFDLPWKSGYKILSLHFSLHVQLQFFPRHSLFTGDFCYKCLFQNFHHTNDAYSWIIVKSESKYNDDSGEYRGFCQKYNPTPVKISCDVSNRSLLQFWYKVRLGMRMASILGSAQRFGQCRLQCYKDSGPFLWEGTNWSQVSKCKFCRSFVCALRMRSFLRWLPSVCLSVCLCVCGSVARISRKKQLTEAVNGSFAHSKAYRL